jgi:hypothetical protein
METVWQAHESLSTDYFTEIVNEAADGLKLKEFEKRFDKFVKRLQRDMN